MQNGFGTLLPVSVQGCQIACSMAGTACEAISYNPTLEACYLKAGGSATDCPVRTPTLSDGELLTSTYTHSADLK
jgi:PAN domain